MHIREQIIALAKKIKELDYNIEYYELLYGLVDKGILIFVDNNLVMNWEYFKIKLDQELLDHLMIIEGRFKS